MMDQFNDFMKLEAIRMYLKSYGYKAIVDNNSMSVKVQDVDINSTLHSICTWNTAREFIEVRSKS